MARIERTTQCVKCNGPMSALSSPAGVIYVCSVCDKPDPIDHARRWVSGSLKPPSK